jgi:uncharacterized protein
MNAPSFFEIQVDDIERAKDFYSKVFNWKFTKNTSVAIEYYRIETEGAHGGLLKRPAPTPQMPAGTNAYVCSMEVKDFDATAEMILSLGGKVALEKFAILGTCWQGYFIDTEGNTFGIFQVDPQAK